MRVRPMTDQEKKRIRDNCNYAPSDCLNGLCPYQDEDLANTIGCTKQYVALKRKNLFGILKRRGPKTYAALYDWDSVDWSLNDTAIARGLGCSRESARVHRKNLGMPPSPMRCKRTYATMADEIVIKARDKKLDIRNLTAAQISEALDITVETAGRVFPHRKVRKYDWSHLAEDCQRHSDLEIASMLGCSMGTVFRRRHLLGIFRHRPRIYKDRPKRFVPSFRKGHDGVSHPWDWSRYTKQDFLRRTDEEIAAEMNCSPTTVAWRRLKLGIRRRA